MPKLIYTPRALEVLQVVKPNYVFYHIEGDTVRVRHLPQFGWAVEAAERKCQKKLCVSRAFLK